MFQQYILPVSWEQKKIHFRGFQDVGNKVLIHHFSDTNSLQTK